MIYTSSLISSARGKLGGSSVSRSFQKNIVKSRNPHRSGTPSPAQLNVRSRYNFACNTLKPISKVLSILYPSRKVRMNPFSFTLSHFIKFAISETVNYFEVSNPFIFPNLTDISDNDSIECTFNPSTEQFQISLTATNNIFLNHFPLFDTLIILIFNPTANRFYFKYEPLLFSSSTFTIETPDVAESDTLYLYLSTIEGCRNNPGFNLSLFQYLPSTPPESLPFTFDSTISKFDTTLLTFDKN
jgi:hypothetical protein